ncbi:MAG: YgiQ family radical SAM protein [Candidatus Aureabacteria bacterium]|nr:YgiQ family radical SAM protein [Candidatus Auribacterota bacterium]
MKNNTFLPISRKDMEKRGWSQLDIILITGDSYVDHPSFGAALIGRFLEHKGFRVGIIAQPNWRNKQDFMVLGKPKLFFGITSGNVDSMIANYTANKKKRRIDDYSAGGKTGLAPDRAILVYANRLRSAYKNTPIVIGGIEASTRRLVHYDYWSNSLRRSMLLDSRADLLVYGMGERQVLEIAERLSKGEDIKSLKDIRGTVSVQNDISYLEDFVTIPSFEEILESKKSFSRAFMLAYKEQDPFTAKTVVQKHSNRFVVQNPPSNPFKTKELDEIYDLPFVRVCHPVYSGSGKMKSYETVKFSITAHRGCCGECSFCVISSHQGRIVQSRSENSILKEATKISSMEDFRGTITDVGGPTANLYKASCSLWETGKGFCKNKKCLTPHTCKNLNLGYDRSIDLYRKISKIKKVKHVFIGSGFRYDLLINNAAKKYLREICKNNISGQMKIAPEHCSNKVLSLMGKPSFGSYDTFVNVFNKTVQAQDKKLFLVNYFISAYPGSSLMDTLELAQYLLKHNMAPEQIQDFIPIPMTLSTCQYYTERDPITDKNIYVPKSTEERKMQRALIQYKSPANRKYLIKALQKLDAMHLLRTFTYRRGGKRKFS